MGEKGGSGPAHRVHHHETFGFLVEPVSELPALHLDAQEAAAHRFPEGAVAVILGQAICDFLQRLAQLSLRIHGYVVEAAVVFDRPAYFFFHPSSDLVVPSATSMNEHRSEVKH